MFKYPKLFSKNYTDYWIDSSVLDSPLNLILNKKRVNKLWIEFFKYITFIMCLNRTYNILLYSNIIIIFSNRIRKLIIIMLSILSWFYLFCLYKYAQKVWLFKVKKMRREKWRYERNTKWGENVSKIKFKRPLSEECMLLKLRWNYICKLCQLEFTYPTICAREEKCFFFFFKLLCVRTLTPSFVCSVLFFIIITHPFGYEILFSRSSQKGIYVYYIIRRTSAASGCRPTLFSRFSFRFPPRIYQRPPHSHNIHTHTRKMHAPTFVWTFLFLNVSARPPAARHVLYL